MMTTLTNDEVVAELKYTEMIIKEVKKKKKTPIFVESNYGK